MYCAGRNFFRRDDSVNSISSGRFCYVVCTQENVFPKAHFLTVIALGCSCSGVCRFVGILFICCVVLCSEKILQ